MNQSSAGKVSDTRRTVMASSGRAGTGQGNLNIHFADAKDSQSGSGDSTEIDPTVFDNNLGQTDDNNFQNVRGSKPGGVQNSERRQAWAEETSMETDEGHDENKHLIKHTLKLFCAIEHLESLLSKSRGEIHDLFQQVVKTEGTNITSDAAQQQELEKELERLRSEEDNLRRDGEKLHNENKKLREDLKKEQDEKVDVKAIRQRYLQEKQKLDKQHQQLKSDFEALRVNYEALEEQSSMKTEDCKKLREDKCKLEEELSRCKTRLSQVMGNKLSNNNPDIADLSDKNRPTKLGEKYSEIYDNQWTDAFEVAEGFFSNEQKSVFALKHLLLDIKRHCDKIHQQQNYRLLKALGIDPATTEELDVNVTKQLNELRKATAEKLVEHVFEKYQKEVSASEYGWLAAEENMKPFVHKCIEFCWLMLVQDPPLAFLQDPAEGGPFDQERYKFYTKSGKKLHFVVWPALLLHANGAVVSKGIAQAMPGLDVDGKAVPKSNIRQLNASVSSTIRQSAHGYPPSPDIGRTSEEVKNKTDVSHDDGDARSLTLRQNTDVGNADKSIMGIRKNKNTGKMPDDLSGDNPTNTECKTFHQLGEMYGYKSAEIKQRFGDRYTIIYNHFAKCKMLPPPPKSVAETDF